METTTQITTCDCCGAVVLDGFEDCRAMFNAVLEREYSDPAFGEAHLFTVDANALQHSEQHGPRSNAFHLMRLCWLLEYGGNPSIRQVQRGGRALYDPGGQKIHALPYLKPPAHRGELTVASVLEAASAAEHAKRAQAWGQSVWNSWSEHHAWAREQVRLWFDRN